MKVDQSKGRRYALYDVSPGTVVRSYQAGLYIVAVDDKQQLLIDVFTGYVQKGIDPKIEVEIVDATLVIK